MAELHNELLSGFAAVLRCAHSSATHPLDVRGCSGTRRPERGRVSARVQPRLALVAVNPVKVFTTGLSQRCSSSKRLYCAVYVENLLRKLWDMRLHVHMASSYSVVIPPVATTLKEQPRLYNGTRAMLQSHCICIHRSTCNWSTCVQTARHCWQCRQQLQAEHSLPQ
jgi:hypothetical protein